LFQLPFPLNPIASLYALTFFFLALSAPVLQKFLTVQLRVVGTALMLMFMVPGFVIVYENIAIMSYCNWCRFLNCLEVFEWCRQHAGYNG
jgi:hypothetical protein